MSRPRARIAGNAPPATVAAARTRRCGSGRRWPEAVLRLVGCASGLCLSSCGPGSGATLDESGHFFAKPWASPVGSAYGEANFEPAFSGIQAGFFERFCTECHQGASASKGLDLSGEEAWEQLVRVRSSGRPDLLLVDPGEAQRSYLVLKLEGDARIAGRQMPRNRPPRPAGEIDIIRAWIDAGALRN